MFSPHQLWLPSYLRRPRYTLPAGVKDVMICVCDHYEPFHEAAKPAALARVRRWLDEFPKLIAPFADADGVHPRHTFFYPVEQYDPDVLTLLAELCAASGGETEIHLHHNHDTAESTRAKLEQGKADLARHGLLPRDATGRVRYGFVHGDWALDNSHPSGAGCGVTNELQLLRETGCYADFTLPSAPDLAQTRTINSLYYAAGTPQPKSHDTGVPVRVLDRPAANAPLHGDLLLVQGPLGLNWERRKHGIFPRIENADLTGTNPPRLDRVRLWLRLGIHVLGRSEWLFVKLHTHGAIERNAGMFLGDAYRRFHEGLLANYNDSREFRVHYVTARELVNILHAAEDGHSGNPGEFRNYRYQLAGK